MRLKVENKLVTIIDIAVDGGDPVYLVEYTSGKRKELSLAEIDSSLVKFHGIVFFEI